jgi:hypothetical protein
MYFIYSAVGNLDGRALTPKFGDWVYFIREDDLGCQLQNFNLLSIAS